MSLREVARAFVQDQRGGVVFYFALVGPILLMLAGGAIDFTQIIGQRQRLQAVVDEAALSAARELGLADAQRESVAAAVQDKVNAAMNSNGSSRHAAAEFGVKIQNEPLQVEVVAEQKTKTYFGTSAILVPPSIRVSSVARIVGRPNICVLALERSELGAIWIEKNAKLTGQGCAVFSNSTSSIGLVVRDSGQLSAENICSSGGADQSGSVTPPAIIDCPQFDDPLASRAEPSIGPCEFNNTVIDNQTKKLRPGVYCGGLIIRGTSDVEFEPGVYIIKGSAFWVGNTAKIKGDGVSFFFDRTSFMFIGPDTTVELAASKTGALAGLLFFGSRQQSKWLTHTILSKNAHYLVGTIYLPMNSFVVDGEAGVGGQSAYTAIVARRLVLLRGPSLVLNTNYDQTDVPVPDSIRGAAQPVRLAR